MSAPAQPGAGTASGDAQAPHEAACLRPFCCNPFAAFSAFSRVGGWTPALPEGGGPAAETGDTGVTGKNSRDA